MSTTRDTSNSRRLNSEDPSQRGVGGLLDSSMSSRGRGVSSTVSRSYTPRFYPCQPSGMSRSPPPPTSITTIDTTTTTSRSKDVSNAVRNKSTLYLAASVGDITLCKYLLENGSSALAVEADGRTAMGVSKEGGFDDVVSMLER